MRNVILRYVFNSDACFYLKKFLSRENGVLHWLLGVNSYWTERKSKGLKGNRSYETRSVLRLKLRFVEGLLLWRTNNPKASFYYYCLLLKYPTIISLKLFSNHCWRLIKFITPCQNDIFYYYIGRTVHLRFCSSIINDILMKNYVK